MFALRAAVAMGAPILTGWALNDISAGLMASIGGFTALYSSGRPYLYRAKQLALIAASFALVVGLGMSVIHVPWVVIGTVALIAMLATWLSNALQVGPPAAYMFTLACAAGTAMPAAHLSAFDATLLVFLGGAFAWLLHMGGALFSPRGPERSAVIAAGKAVSAYLEAIGKESENTARHRGASALYAAWTVLVNQQSKRWGGGEELGRLRAINRQLHLLFAEAPGVASRSQPLRTDAIAVRRLIDEVKTPKDVVALEHDAIPLGHPSALDALIEALQPNGNSFRVIMRVGVAAVIVGVLGSVFHLEHAYWAIAATVLVLHQGFDWLRMVRRSIERLLGTWVGLLLAGAILLLAPSGPWLVLTVMVLQFIIEMLVIRNYALAAVFITAIALTIASGGHPVDAPIGYLLARGVDTFVGCVAGLLIFRAIPPRAAARHIPQQLVRVLVAVDATIAHLADGNVTSIQARADRRGLQLASFALAHAYEESIATSRSQRRDAELLWPTIAAAERLAYRTLSSCWALERSGKGPARDLADDGVGQLHRAVQALVAGIQNNMALPPLERLPHVIEEELINLHAAWTAHTGKLSSRVGHGQGRPS